MSAVEVYSEPSSFVEVHVQMDAIESWAQRCESVPELRDAINKCAAIDEYLARTSTEGRSRVAAAMRRLEVRIGALLGPPHNGGDRKSDQFDRDRTDLSKDQRAQFRQMAENSEVVEQVISESSDERPPSRRKVMERIAEAGAAPFRSSRAREARVAKAREMAAEGHTSRQIADALGLSLHNFGKWKSDNGVEVPADVVVGKTRAIDPNRIVSETVSALEGLAMGVDLISVADLDASQAEAWATSLSNSLRSLNRLTKQLKEMVQ